LPSRSPTVAAETTALFTIELDTLAPGDVGVPLPASSAAMDNGVLLRAVERQARLRRWVSVLKLRQSGFDPAIREFVIGDRGVEVGDTADEEYPGAPRWTGEDGAVRH
jgi:circadian clock protein KaiC